MTHKEFFMLVTDPNVKTSQSYPTSQGTELTLIIIVGGNKKNRTRCITLEAEGCFCHTQTQYITLHIINYYVRPSVQSTMKYLNVKLYTIVHTL